MGSVLDSDLGVGGVATTGGVDAFVSYSHGADGLLAPRLQGALQRFAKPWWRRRAMRVFRDESSLSANPHLWSSITAALDSAEWFILLLSPDAALSPWVNREVEYWLGHKDPDRILPVLTEGRFVWDDATGSVNPGSSVPPALLGAFAEEPRWVDLRWAREETQLDLRDSRFRGAVADIASAVRGVPKDDLESEEVRQHRRTVRTAWAAGVALAVLAVTAGVAAVYANGQRQDADAQRLVAEEQTGIAVANEARAEEQTVLAEEARQLARSRELAASAINVLDDDPELSILLGLEAIDVAPQGSDLPIESVSALRQAIQASRLRSRHKVAESPETLLIDLLPDGSALAVASVDAATVTLYDTGTFDVLWEYSDSETVDSISNLFFSPSGDRLAVGFLDSGSIQATPRGEAETDDGLEARVVMLDGTSGDVVGSRRLGECPTAWLSPFSPDGAWLPVSVGDGAACDDDSNPQGETGWRIELLDPVSLTVLETIPTAFTAEVSWSADSSRMSTDTFEGTGATVFDTATWEVVSR
ncbi:MAG: TIR domain-containing protein, partial [Acidimicrobiia bacterium]